MGKNKDILNVLDKYLVIGYITLILLHISGGFWHSYYNWGFSYWYVIPNYLVVLFGGFAILSILIVFRMRDKIKLIFVDRIQITNRSLSIRILLIIISSVILSSFLYLLRSNAHVYGDGFSILEFVSTMQSIELIDQHRLQFLSIFLHNSLFKLLSQIPFLGKENIFALTNVLGGVIGFWAIFNITGLLSRNNRERLFFLVLTMSSASVILFFGYIENYTWAMSFMLWSIYYGIKYLKNETSIYPLIICAFISFAFHIITLPMLATIVIFLLYKNESTKKFMHNLRRFHFIAYIIIGSLLILFLSQMKELDVFVPLWGLPNNNYSLFTISHLSDIINLLLLLAPLGLIFLLVSMKNYKNNCLINDSTEKVLFIISLLTFLSACFIDPQLGMIRDFDLLSFFGIPFSLWSGYRFTRMYSETHFPVWVIFASAIVVIVHIVPNIYEKHHLDVAVEHLDEILWEDPHYQESYQEAHRGLSWAAILQSHTMKDSLSKKYYTRIANIGKKKTTQYYNLGVLYNDNNQLDSARYYLRQGIAINPLEKRFLSLLAEVEYKSNNYKLAELYAMQSIGQDSNYINGLTALAVIYFSQNKKEEALIYYRKAYKLEPNNYSCIKNMGYYYSRDIDADSAIYYLNKALPLAPKREKIIILEKIIPITITLARKDEATKLLEQLKLLSPASQLLIKFEKVLNAQ